MGKFGGWLAGLLATIIGGYAVWYFTQPPAPPSTTTFEGMVYSGSSPVASAMVSVNLTGSGVDPGPYHNVTDENGAYRLDLIGLPKTAGATLSVAASGYRDSAPKALFDPLVSVNRQDFPLTPLTPVAEAPAPGGAQHPPLPHLPLYVAKAAAQATRIKLK